MDKTWNDDESNKQEEIFGEYVNKCLMAKDNYE